MTSASVRPAPPPMTARDVVQQDLEDVCGRLKSELAALQGKRLFISGGAGFLGYYLIQAALHWNVTRPGPPVQVVACDNYMRGVPAWLTGLASNPALTLLQHDITTPLPDGLGDLDFVIHAASIASPTYYRQHPIETMDANVNGLRLLLERCRAQHAAGRPVAGFLFFSTSEIYGDPTPDQIPTPETYRGNVSCTGPRACYDESKRFGETLCVNFARAFDLPVTIARPFNNYGPGLKITDRRVIADFARDLLAGRDLVLLSDGSPTRTFCYVADAVVGYYKILVRGRAVVLVALLAAQLVDRLAFLGLGRVEGLLGALELLRGEEFRDRLRVRIRQVVGDPAHVGLLALLRAALVLRLAAGADLLLEGAEALEDVLGGVAADDRDRGLGARPVLAVAGLALLVDRRAVGGVRAGRGQCEGEAR